MEPRTPAECLAEMQVNDRHAVHGLMTIVDATGIGQVISCEDFSSLDHLLAITTLVLKLCVILLDRIWPDDSPTSGIRKAIADELWIAECQRKCVADKNFLQ